MQMRLQTTEWKFKRLRIVMFFVKAFKHSKFVAKAAVKDTSAFMAKTNPLVNQKKVQPLRNLLFSKATKVIMR